MTMTTTSARHDQLSDLHDPFAAPGALTPPGASPIVRALAIEKYFGEQPRSPRLHA